MQGNDGHAKPLIMVGKHIAASDGHINPPILIFHHAAPRLN
jgi:hypothetical protein